MVYLLTWAKLLCSRRGRLELRLLSTGNIGCRRKHSVLFQNRLNCFRCGRCSRSLVGGGRNGTWRWALKASCSNKIEHEHASKPSFPTGLGGTLISTGLLGSCWARATVVTAAITRSACICNRLENAGYTPAVVGGVSRSRRSDLFCLPFSGA